MNTVWPRMDFFSFMYLSLSIWMLIHTYKRSTVWICAMYIDSLSLLVMTSMPTDIKVLLIYEMLRMEHSYLPWMKPTIVYLYPFVYCFVIISCLQCCFSFGCSLCYVCMCIVYIPSNALWPPTAPTVNSSKVCSNGHLHKQNCISKAWFVI